MTVFARLAYYVFQWHPCIECIYKKYLCKLLAEISTILVFFVVDILNLPIKTLVNDDMVSPLGFVISTCMFSPTRINNTMLYVLQKSNQPAAARLLNLQSNI